MGAEHGHALHYHAHSVVHRLPANVKIPALLGFVLVVVATPRNVGWPYAGYLVLLLIAAGLAHVPYLFLARRLLIETPFVVFALVLPFVASGNRIDVLGLSLSEPGLVAAWALLAKGTLGVLASLLLAATTEPRDLLVGLARLKVPAALVEIAGFMVRYIDVVANDAGRMRVALASRGFEARSPRQWPVVARSMGALFVRCYERGERVHLAMLSRGYSGRIVAPAGAPATTRDIVTASALPAAAVSVLLAWAVIR